MAKAKARRQYMVCENDDHPSSFCCGLQEIGDLHISEVPRKDYRPVFGKFAVSDRSATFATTNARTQLREEAQLWKQGFRKIASFVNPLTRNKINMWLKKPKGQRW